MGLFERYLTLWVGLGMLAGVGLGLWIPGLFQAVAAMEWAHVNLVVAAFICCAWEVEASPIESTRAPIRVAVFLIEFTFGIEGLDERTKGAAPGVKSNPGVRLDAAGFVGYRLPNRNERSPLTASVSV